MKASDIAVAVAVFVMAKSGYADFGAMFKADLIDSSFMDGEVGRVHDEFYPENPAYAVEPGDGVPVVGGSGAYNISEEERARLIAIGENKAYQAIEREKEAVAIVTDKPWRVDTTTEKTLTYGGLAVAAGVLAYNQGWLGLGGNDGDSEQVPANPDTFSIGDVNAGGGTVTVNVNINKDSYNQHNE